MTHSFPTRRSSDLGGPSMRSHRLAFTFAALLAAFAGSSAHAATEIQFWHSMEGALGERVNELVQEFNKKNPDYKVNAVYKGNRSEEHTSELQSLMRISYAVFCLKKKKKIKD